MLTSPNDNAAEQTELAAVANALGYERRDATMPSRTPDGPTVAWATYDELWQCYRRLWPLAELARFAEGDTRPKVATETTAHAMPPGGRTP